MISKLITYFFKKKFKNVGKNVVVRYACKIDNGKKIQLGNDVFIGEHVWLNAGNFDNKNISLEIRDGSYISRFCHINAFEKVIIEKDVLLGEGVYVGDTDHATKNKNLPIIKQGFETKGKVVIGTGSHICKGAVISAGVKIGRNVVVGPNSFVTQHEIPDYSLVVGNPAVIISDFNLDE